MVCPSGCESVTLPCFTGLSATMYDDPVQGSIDNCGLIAAMSSVAWVSQRKKLICSYDSVKKTYKATFYSPTAGVEVNNCFDNNGALTPGRDEVWVRVYEKAYAKQYMKCADPCCPLPREGWPGNSCVPINKLTGLTSAVVTSGFANAITPLCTDSKTKVPMAIWTKEILEADKAIRPNHSYSILGFVDPYIILRDPKRVLPDNTPRSNPNCLLQGTFTFTNNFVMPSTCPGSYSPGASLIITFGSNGILGVHKNKCNDNTWFEGMCYGIC